MDCKIINLEAERDKRLRTPAFRAALNEVKRSANEPVINVDVLDDYFKKHPYKFKEESAKKED